MHSFCCVRRVTDTIPMNVIAGDAFFMWQVPPRIVIDCCQSFDCVRSERRGRHAEKCALNSADF
jgi:hypothetical protein